jgi:eukaryotic-like serine/threonine-protein kinase
MNTSRWEELEVLFEHARALPSRERDNYLDEACPANSVLRAELEALLVFDEEAQPLIERLSQHLRPVIADSTGAWDPYGLIGRRVSHYEVRALAGRGGMGLVYRAWDADLEREVALKLLPLHVKDDPAARDRFVHEARAASAHDHPNICTVYEVDQLDDGALFIAMKWYDGESLRDCIARGPLPVEQALGVAAQVARGLQAAHARRIVHRDIKPGNVLITSGGVAKILDFGLVKSLDIDLTGTDSALGTAAYMSPEQARGEKVDARTDLWSLGVTLHEMLTGERAFRGEYNLAVMHAILHDEPAPLPSEVPAAVSTIVNRCLRKDRNARYGSAAELLADLENVCASNAEPAHPRSQHRLRLWVAASLLCLMAAPVLLSPLPSPLANAWFMQRDHEVRIEVRIIAVLPFANVGGDPSGQFYADGLMETLASRLSQLERFNRAFWVVPASEVRALGITSPSAARRLLGARLVVTGSVQLTGDDVRLTLDLIDTRALRSVGSKVIDLRKTEPAALQDDVLSALSDLLDLELRPEEGRRLAAGISLVPGALDFFAQGQGYLHSGRVGSIDLAIDLFRRSLALDSAFALAHAALGEALWRRFETSLDPQWAADAQAATSRALDLDARAAHAHVTHGLVLNGTGRREEARRAYQRALVLEPENVSALLGIAHVHEASGDSTAAEAAYRRAIAARPEYWRGHKELGLFCFRRGRLKDAITHYRQVVALTPDNSNAFSSLGGLYFYAGIQDEAIAMFEKSIALAPTSNAFSNLGTLYFYQSRFDEAVTAYEQALEHGDTDYRVWGHLASAYSRAGREDAVEPALRHAIRRAMDHLTVDPRSAETVASLSAYHATLGEETEARAHLANLERLEPSDGGALFLAGSTSEMLGDRESALLWLEKAVRQGYPLAEIENDPELADLRGDPRYVGRVRAQARRFEEDAL